MSTYDRLSSRQTAAFTAGVALAAIFVDASLGHGLTWENDPYWTYWVTKTLLIATVFGLGTAWFGVGIGQGAVITAVHTLILTVYYWTFSPVGLPSQPTWLDLEHTWLTGLPIHFAVIYVGYLVALLVYRRAFATDARDAWTPSALGWRSLIVGVGIVVVAGGSASLALGEFPGVTWFIVRLLLTVAFLLVWWGLAASDTILNIVGAIALAFAWATYSQFVGPVGLPDTPLRLLDATPPAVSVRWLDYTELWVISLPIYLLIMLVAIPLAGATGRRRTPALRRPLAAAAVLPLVLLTMGLTVEPDERGQSATFSADGDVQSSAGAGSGSVTLNGTDMGDRVTPLPPHDQVRIDATIDGANGTWDISAHRAMVEDPLGEETTWWGVGFGVDYVEGDESLEADVAAFGLAEIRRDGALVGRGVPVEIVASREEGYGLELVVGNEATSLPELQGEPLEFTWQTYVGEAPDGLEMARYAVGGAALFVLLVLALLGSRRSASSRRARPAT